jgi:hypothetical protein
MNDFHCVTLERAGKLYRAMNGDEAAQKAVSFADIEGLQNAPTFLQFLLWNKEHLEVPELAREVYA